MTDIVLNATGKYVANNRAILALQKVPDLLSSSALMAAVGFMCGLRFFF